MERNGLMSEKAVPDPWDAVVMPTDCAGVAVLVVLVHQLLVVLLVLLAQ